MRRAKNLVGAIFIATILIGGDASATWEAESALFEGSGAYNDLQFGHYSCANQRRRCFLDFTDMVLRPAGEGRIRIVEANSRTRGARELTVIEVTEGLYLAENAPPGANARYSAIEIRPGTLDEFHFWCRERKAQRAAADAGAQVSRSRCTFGDRDSIIAAMRAMAAEHGPVLNWGNGVYIESSHYEYVGYVAGESYSDVGAPSDRSNQLSQEPE